MANTKEQTNSDINNAFLMSAEASKARRLLREKDKQKSSRRNRLLGYTSVLLATGALLVGTAGKSLAESGSNPTANPKKIEQIYKPKQEKQNKIEIPYAGYELSKSVTKQLDAQLPIIESLKPLYEQAAAATNMPWYVIAAIHYEEANNDPNMSAFAGEVLGTKNPDGQGVNGVAPIDQLENYKAALKHARMMGEDVYGIEINSKTQDIKILEKVFLAYNRGWIYKNNGLSPKDSPYVYSGLSKNGKDFSNIFPDVDSLAGRVDERPGAMAVVVYLMRDELK